MIIYKFYNFMNILCLNIEYKNKNFRKIDMS